MLYIIIIIWEYDAHMEYNTDTFSNNLYMWRQLRVNAFVDVLLRRHK